MLLHTMEPLPLGHLYSGETSILGTQTLVPKICSYSLCTRCPLKGCLSLFGVGKHFFRDPKLFLKLHYDPRGGTLGISGWGCAAGTLEPLAYTRASSAEFC